MPARHSPNGELLFELGMLKRLPRSGWLTIGIKGCESVAEHAFRACAIAYLLAKMQKLTPEKTEKALAAALFHDLAETRTGDLNSMNKKYCRANHGKATRDILKGVQPGAEILASLSDAGISPIVEDADKLELILQALEYADAGNARAAVFAKSAAKRIKTASGKRLLAEIMKTSPAGWLFRIRGGE